MITNSGPDPAKRLVLYIEDNSTNLALVEELLSRRADLELLSCSTGEEGIALACARQPDVILMDIKLPDMSGIDALIYLRDHSESGHIPIMALSSNAYPCQIDQGIEAGFLRYLTKPFMFAEFNDALDACLKISAERHQMFPTTDGQNPHHSCLPHNGAPGPA
jgi:CheY-like chemotaxis protein